MGVRRKWICVLVTAMLLCLFIPETALCSELPTLESEDSILKTNEEPDTKEGEKAMSKAIKGLSGLVISVGAVLIAIAVFNLIVAFADQEPSRMSAAKISLGIGASLLFIMPILRAIGVIR